MPITTRCFSLLLIASINMNVAFATEQCLPAFYTTVLNKVPNTDIISFLNCKKTGLMVKQSDLIHWRFNLVDQTPTVIHQQNYYALSQFSGLQYHLDQSNLSVDIMAPPHTFIKTNLAINQPNPLPNMQQTNGAFLNYDVQAASLFGVSNYGGVFDIGVFNRWGTGTLDLFASNQGNITRFNRLTTTWQLDTPGKMQSIRLGDTITMPGMWGNSVSFGGAQWSTNFGTQPYFVTFPLPAATGVAVVPTSLNIFVNNTLIASRRVEPGPFDIQAIPVVNGMGEITLVETDLLGRQRTVNVPYYLSSQLLKPGLHDFSYSIGAVRQNYGIYSFDYGPPLVTGMDTVGITNRLTLQWYGELLQPQQMVGGSAIYLLPALGIVTGALSCSHQDQFGEGALALVKFDRRLNNYSIGISNQWTSERYSQLGYASGQFLPSVQTQIYFGITLPKNIGNLGTSFTNQVNRDGIPTQRLISVNYSRNVFNNSFFNISGITNIGGQTNQALLASLNFSLEGGHNLNVGGTLQPGGKTATAQLSKNLPEDNGYGYSAFATVGDIKELRGSFALQRDFGNYNAQGDLQNGRGSYQLDTQGAIVLMGGRAYFTKQINDSFAVIQIPGYQGVGVYQNNQLVAHTNKNGEALLTGLTAYQDNPIAINMSDLPLNAAVTTLKQDVIPYYRSGVLIKYNIKPARAAIISIRSTNGTPLATDAIVTVNDDPTVFPVGYNGQLYITDLDQENIIHVKDQDQTCEFNLNYPETKSPMPDLGTFICGNSQPTTQSNKTRKIP